MDARSPEGPTLVTDHETVASVLDVWFRDETVAWHTPHVFRAILAELRRRHPQVVFHAIDPRSLGLPKETLEWQGSPASSHMMRLVHPPSGAHSVISFWDNNYAPLMRHMGWEPALLRQLIATSGISEAGYEGNRHQLAESRPLQAFHVPFTYNIFRLPDYARIEEQRTQTAPLARRSPELCFRGFLYELRTEILAQLPRDLVRVYDARRDGSLEPAEYLAELAAHQMGFSLNGAGEICNRDMEILGLGIPLFRPELHCQFHEPLIPDVHYVRACRAPEVAVSGTFRFLNPRDAADEMVSNYARWQREPEALEQIGRNGRAWFERNVLLERQAALACDLLDLALLH